MISCLDFVPFAWTQIRHGTHVTLCRRAPWRGRIALILPPHPTLVLVRTEPNHSKRESRDRDGMTLRAGLRVGPFDTAAHGDRDMLIELFNPGGNDEEYYGAGVILLSVDVAKT